jgi:hypothetical protein
MQDGTIIIEMIDGTLLNREGIMGYDIHIFFARGDCHKTVIV